MRPEIMAYCQRLGERSREAARVLAPGGVIVAAVITRFASTLDGFVKGYHADPEFVEIYSHTQVSGEHRGSADGQRYFTTAYFHRPDEVPYEVAAAGLMLERLVSVEGPAWMFGTLPAIMSDERATALLLEQLRQLEGEPSLFGASSHLLAVARDGASGAGGDEDGGAGEQAPA